MMRNVPIFLALLMILLTITNSKDYLGEKEYYILMGVLFLSGVLISIRYLEKKRIMFVIIAIFLSIILYFLNI